MIAKRLVLGVALTCSIVLAGFTASAQESKEGATKDKSAKSKNPQVVMATNLGAFTLELYPDKAPATVDNFLDYVREGFYQGTIFHRVIAGFMIQGGGFDAKLERKPANKPIKNEADNGLSNVRGTIAMARTSDPHSASSQFFINVVDNSHGLDYGKARDKWGYCVFGRVIDGMEVVDKIRNTPVAPKGGHQHYPKQEVLVEKCWVVGEEKEEKSKDES